MLISLGLVAELVTRIYMDGQAPPHLYGGGGDCASAAGFGWARPVRFWPTVHQ